MASNVDEKKISLKKYYYNHYITNRLEEPINTPLSHYWRRQNKNKSSFTLVRKNGVSSPEVEAFRFIASLPFSWWLLPTLTVRRKVVFPSYLFFRNLHLNWSYAFKYHVFTTSCKLPGHNFLFHLNSTVPNSMMQELTSVHSFTAFTDYTKPHPFVFVFLRFHDLNSCEKGVIKELFHLNVYILDFSGPF